jgi:hypothetical protein
MIRQNTGNYTDAIHIIAGVMFVALILPLLAKRLAEPPQSRPIIRHA